MDKQGTMYAPTSVSLDTGAFIETGCPIHFEVNENDTFVQFVDTNTTLLLTFTDHALLDTTLVMARAVRAMLLARGLPFPEEFGGEPT